MEDCGSKKQRVDSQNSEKMEHCQYFVKRKKRFCKMTVKQGNKFCGEHMQVSEEVSRSSADDELGVKRRIPCPIDSSHTCNESKLQKHMKVCNAKKRLDTQPAYIVDGINQGDTSQNPKHVSLNLLDKNIVNSIIERIELVYAQLPEVKQLILQHEVLDSEVNNSTYGNNTKKHLIQNASLLGHINHAKLVRENTCFIEFGAGKGKLTYWLAQMLKDIKDTTIVLVDRSSHRNKSENKLKNEEMSVNTIRIRADIGDLVLNKIEDIQKIKYKVGIAKHLCGAATDLTMQCLSHFIQEDINSEVSGLVIAFCCHHRCNYSSYVGKHYLKNSGFTPEEFPILCSIASWATCGSGKNREAQKQPIDDVKIEEREAIGRKVKAILNWGRLDYLKRLGFESSLYYYTTPDVSLENMCIVATRLSEKSPTHE